MWSIFFNGENKKPHQQQERMTNDHLSALKNGVFSAKNSSGRRIEEQKLSRLTFSSSILKWNDTPERSSFFDQMPLINTE